MQEEKGRKNKMRMLASIWDCSVLNSSTISKMFKWAFPARVLTLLCQPSRLLFVHGPSIRWVITVSTHYITTVKVVFVVLSLVHVQVCKYG